MDYLFGLARDNRLSRSPPARPRSAPDSASLSFTRSPSSPRQDRPPVLAHTRTAAGGSLTCMHDSVSASDCTSRAAIIDAKATSISRTTMGSSSPATRMPMSRSPDTDHASAIRGPWVRLGPVGRPPPDCPSGPARRKPHERRQIIDDLACQIQPPPPPSPPRSRPGRDVTSCRDRSAKPRLGRRCPGEHRHRTSLRRPSEWSKGYPRRSKGIGIQSPF